MTQQTTAIQKSNGSFKDYLELRKGALAGVLPRHLTPERVCKVALVAYNKTPKLRECTMESLFLAIMQASELGLEPGGALGHAYLVPYKDQCQFIPGYRGLIELARRSGEIESIEAHVVHERDTFDLRFGLDAKLSHTPFLDGDPGQMRFVYAVAKLKGGSWQFEVMTKLQVDAIRGRSRAGSNGPWVTDYEEMARKTVVRRLVKYLPLSAERAQDLAKALEADDADYVDTTANLVSVDAPTEAQTKTQKIAAKLKAKDTAQASAPVEPQHDPQTGEVKDDEPERDPNTGEVVPPPEPKTEVVATAAGGKVQIHDQQ